MLKYPGLGLPLLHHIQNHNGEVRRFPEAMHPSHSAGDLSELVLVREVAMMIVMDRLTDKPDFHIKVFDDEIANKWKTEALAIPVEQLWQDVTRILDPTHGPKRPNIILNEACMDYCIQELRHKAKFYKETGVVPTLEGSASVAKSDILIEQSLHDALLAGFLRLKEEQAGAPDWHPGTNNTVQDLVHPSLYPLVYGKTRVLQDPVVGVEEAIDKWAGRGEEIPIPEAQESVYWSKNFQWLPANLKFREDGSLEFTSYINNLHPIKHRDTYRAIERLVEKALPLWDTCLSVLDEEDDYTTVGTARTKPRFDPPESPDDENGQNWDPPNANDIHLEPRNGVNEADGDGSDGGGQEEDDDANGWNSDTSEHGRWYSGKGRRGLKWKMTREPVYPEPPPFKAWNYDLKNGATLREKYQNLQVIVKIASIELTPEKPEFPAGSWHLEGQMNERIIGTALYYLDSENVTPSQLHFRMKTDDDQSDLQEQVGQGSYNYLERCYGVGFDDNDGAIQNYGSVETRQGRLLAFPNIFQHRVSPFELEDRTKPGHRRFIALWLVDPTTPIISTANVPPQQQSWWLEKAEEDLFRGFPDMPWLQAAAASRGQSFPTELTQMIVENFEDVVTRSVEDAKKHRLELMEARTALQDGPMEEWNSGGYNFCEH